MIYGLIIYTIASFFTECVIFYLSFQILGEKILWKKLLIGALLADLAAAPLIYLGSLHVSVSEISPFYFSVFLDFFALLLNLIFLGIIFRHNLWSVMISGIFSYFIYYQTYLCTLLFVPSQYMMGSLRGQFISITLLLFFTIFLGKLIQKLKISFFISHYLQSKKQCLATILLGLTLFSAPRCLIFLSSLVTDTNTLLAATGLILLFFFWFFLHFTMKSIIQTQTEITQKNMIAQQNAYIHSLEDIQKEIRTYRHDFKNLMSGMYLDVREGRTDAVETYIQTILHEFDTTLDAKIQLANQMVNIEIVELKSLLLTKLSKMHTLGIPCRIEVLYPVKRCSVKLSDLLRCIGILMDNAMEAAFDESGDVDVMITAQGGEIIFLISNSLSSAPNLSDIWKKGYSTKGDHRGIGLYSYQQITNSYKNVSCSSSFMNGRFYQELRIGGTSYDSNFAL